MPTGAKLAAKPIEAYLDLMGKRGEILDTRVVKREGGDRQEYEEGVRQAVYLCMDHQS